MNKPSMVHQEIRPKERYETIRIFRTVEGTGKHIAKAEVKQGKRLESAADLQIDPHEQYQTMLGFGGAFTEAAAYVLQKTTPAKRREVIEAYYSSRGLNYTLGRAHMNSCDFSLNSYSCDDTDGDFELRDFTLARDRQYAIPLIKDAMAVAESPVKLMISPWSPPAWMKTNGRMDSGGALKSECREVWARFFARFIQAYEAEGLPVWAVSVQNEPEATQVWESCLYTAEEEGRFVRDYLGPQLDKDGLGRIKILIWDHNRDRLYDRATATLADQETAKYVWGIGFHWYSGDQFGNVERTYQRFPDKPLVFTEGCIERGVKLGQWDRGEIYAHNIIGDLNSGMAAWIDWNLALDRNGGPNHVGNFCDAPVIVDTETGEVHYQSSFHYIGHFSKFIRPGAKRIGLGSGNPSVGTTAFINPDGGISVVLLNRGDEAMVLNVDVMGVSAQVECPAHSIQTVLFE